MTELRKPSRRELSDYIAALQRGWSPDNVRGAAAAEEELEAIATDADLFLEQMDDPDARGEPITLPNGSLAPRLPGYRRWIWDDAFCGSIRFRWRAGTSDLPPHVLGHIGCSIVPWMRRQGRAKRALALLLADARTRGLAYVELTTDADNIASQGVMLANGAVLVERFAKHAAYGGQESLRFRIDL